MMTAAKRYAYGEKSSTRARDVSNESATNLWIILGIAGMQRDCFEIQTAVEIYGRNDVLKSWYDPLDSGNVLLLEGKWSGGRRHLGGRRRWASRSGGHSTLS